jgi:hypothetical protein
VAVGAGLGEKVMKAQTHPESGNVVLRPVKMGALLTLETLVERRLVREILGEDDQK